MARFSRCGGIKRGAAPIIHVLELNSLHRQESENFQSKVDGRTPPIGLE